MLSFIFIAVKIIILLGFLIFIHELGHFTIAKLCNVKVNEFALGFGPVLFSKQGKETKYQLRLIPLGGFVSMEGETEHSNEKRAFNKASISKRIAIVAAGGLINIFCALILYFGLQTVKADNYSTVISELAPNYAAETSGIMPNDKIVKINNKRVYRPTDVNEILEKSKGNDVKVTIYRNDGFIDYNIKPTAVSYKATGMYFTEDNDTIIKGFDKSSSIENQGFKVGDKILAVDDIEVEDDVNKLVEVLQSNFDKEIVTFKIKRNDEIINVEAKPILETRYMLGTNFKEADRNIASNFFYAVLDTKDFAFSVVDNLKMILSGKVSTQEMMGPVGISKVVAKTSNVEEFILIMAVVSLSLGVTNLLPFPALDGGKIVLLIIERIRKKPLQEKYEVGIQMVGFALMIILSIYITFNDIFRAV